MEEYKVIERKYPQDMRCDFQCKGCQVKVSYVEDISNWNFCPYCSEKIKGGK